MRRSFFMCAVAATIVGSGCARGVQIAVGGGGYGGTGDTTVTGTGVGTTSTVSSTSSGPPCTTQSQCVSLNDACNVGTCDPMKGCVKTPVNNGASCDDAKFCTMGDVCANGVCSGTPKTCPMPTDPCQVAKCDEASMGCTNVAGNDGASCPGGTGCVQNVCSAGMCVAGPPITTCVNGDGCCPAACNSTNDTDCGSCATNIAPNATASDSGGGVTTHGPQAMNDNVGPNCTAFAWINNNTTPSGAWIELDWPSAVSVGSFYIETDNGLTPTCFGQGRNLASGTVQTWNGSTWVNAGSFSGLHGNVQYNMPTPVSTTKLRVFNITTDPGNGNSIIFEWHVYTGTSCSPPP